MSNLNFMPFEAICGGLQFFIFILTLIMIDDYDAFAAVIIKKYIFCTNNNVAVQTFFRFLQ
jgi:hypothetical protein